MNEFFFLLWTRKKLIPNINLIREMMCFEHVTL